jgi:hypothetical protein
MDAYNRGYGAGLTDPDPDPDVVGGGLGVSTDEKKYFVGSAKIKKLTIRQRRLQHQKQAA